MRNKWVIFAYNYATEDLNVFATFTSRDNARQVKKALNKKQKTKREIWYFIEKMQLQRLDD